MVCEPLWLGKWAWGSSRLSLNAWTEKRSLLEMTGSWRTGLVWAERRPHPTTGTLRVNPASDPQKSRLELLSVHLPSLIWFLSFPPIKTSDLVCSHGRGSIPLDSAASTEMKGRKPPGLQSEGQRTHTATMVAPGSYKVSQLPTVKAGVKRAAECPSSKRTMSFEPRYA